MMTNEEKVARLAAILGIDGAVQYGAYHGYGERSHKKGCRVARLGGHNGDGRTDADALRGLVRELARTAEYAPKAGADDAASLMRSAEAARIRERAARADAEKYEHLARMRENDSREIAAQFALYRADVTKWDE